MSDVRTHLAKGRPVFPADHAPETKARLRGEARLSHPELYAFETEVPEDIRTYRPDLAEQIDQQRQRRKAA